jgi:hypothetical protein
MFSQPEPQGFSSLSNIFASNSLNSLIWIPLHNLIDQFLTQLSHVISSDKTQRSAIGAVVFGVLFAILLVLASGTYALFYWLYIPRVTHVLPMYLQYGAPLEGGNVNSVVSGGSNFHKAIMNDGYGVKSPLILFKEMAEGAEHALLYRKVWYPFAYVDFTGDIDPTVSI